jgi:hypothetical protein
MLFGFFLFIAFANFSKSINSISFRSLSDLLFMKSSTKVTSGAVLSTVARSEIAFTWYLSVGDLSNKKELV